MTASALISSPSHWAGRTVPYHLRTTIKRSAMASSGFRSASHNRYVCLKSISTELSSKVSCNSSVPDPNGQQVVCSNKLIVCRVCLMTAYASPQPLRADILFKPFQSVQAALAGPRCLVHFTEGVDITNIHRDQLGRPGT